MEDCWDALEGALTEEGEPNTAVGGDLNAETWEWLQEQLKRMDAASKRLHDMMESCGLTAQATGRTYRAGTQIDNWLVSEGLAERMGRTTTLPGVSGRDHGAVVSTYIGGTSKCSGPQRPTGRAERPRRHLQPS